jgi:hypothetical protein
MYGPWEYTGHRKKVAGFPLPGFEIALFCTALYPVPVFAVVTGVLKHLYLYSVPSPLYSTSTVQVGNPRAAVGAVSKKIEIFGFRGRRLEAQG